MNIEDFLSSYFEDSLDEEELNEMLIAWLIENDEFVGPINCVEDAEISDIKIISTSFAVDNDTATVQTQFIVKLHFDYVNSDEQDCEYNTEFEITCKFIFNKDEFEDKNNELLFKCDPSKIVITEIKNLE